VRGDGGMTEIGQTPVSGFVIQLTQVYVYEARVTRRTRQRGDALTLDAKVLRSQREKEGGVFHVLVGATVLLPIGTHPRGAAEFECSVNGTFRYMGKGVLDEALCKRFIDKEALILLWPYVRAATSELARMAELPLPLLPVLDVTRVVAAPETVTVHSTGTGPVRATKQRAAEAPQGYIEQAGEETGAPRPEAVTSGSK
jgi:preprotein translocase subunit SecB